MSGNSQVASKTVEATVAAGRSVHDSEGRLYTQGKKVCLDPAEVKRLRKLGFLAEKDEDVVLGRPRPSVNAHDGPRVMIA